MRKKILLLLLTFLFSFLSNIPVSAHPLDEIGDVRTYDQTQKIEVSPDNTKLTIDLTFYALDKNKVWESIDKNRDQTLTPKESDNWMKLGQNASWMEVGGVRHEFDADSITFPEYYDFFSSKPADVVITFNSDFKSSPGDQLLYHYQGKDKPLSEIKFEAKGINGLNLTDLNSVTSDSISFKVQKGEQISSQFMGIKGSSKLNNFLNKYVKVEKVPPSLALTALVVAFLIGMLHALTPGHGKVIVAGYLVGEKGTVWHAVQLGLIITITHTSSVFILGLAALFLTQYIVPLTIIKWMNLLSGFLVTGFGLYLLVSRTRSLLIHPNHSNFPVYDHEHEGHHHNHDNETSLTWKNLLPLGISGGIVPCIDALAILIVAISLGKIVFGITLLVLFSLGLASALIIGGIAVVITKNKALKKISIIGKYQKYVSIASAIVVTILGIAILLGKQL